MDLTVKHVEGFYFETASHVAEVNEESITLRV